MLGPDPHPTYFGGTVPDPTFFFRKQIWERQNKPGPDPQPCIKLIRIYHERRQFLHISGHNITKFISSIFNEGLYTLIMQKRARNISVWN